MLKLAFRKKAKRVIKCLCSRTCYTKKKKLDLRISFVAGLDIAVINAKLEVWDDGASCVV